MYQEFVQVSDYDTPTDTRSRKNKRKKSLSAGDSALSAYMRSMGDYPTFTVDEERETAVALREARCDRWAALLCYPPLVPSVHKLIAQKLEVEDALEAELTELEVTAERFRLRRTLANQAEFEGLCKTIGAKLPDIDIDSELADLLIADVERIAKNERDGLTVEVARMPGDSRPFRNYLAACRKSQRRVRRLSETFTKANLRLVVSLARRLSRGQLPLQDLIQEGNIGLLKAIERFDHRRGFRFSTYAGWWIRHSISRAIYNKGRQVRLPVHVHDASQKITKVRRAHLAKEGREPTIEELEKQTGIAAAKIERIVRLEQGPIISLDAPASRTDDRAAVDMLEDETEPDPGWALEAVELEQGLEDALSCLRPMEADILRRRYGLENTEPETLREIGERYALSRERIRQLQERAVEHMRDEFQRLRLL